MGNVLFLAGCSSCARDGSASHGLRTTCRLSGTSPHGAVRHFRKTLGEICIGKATLAVELRNNEGTVAPTRAARHGRSEDWGVAARILNTVAKPRTRVRASRGKR